MDISKAFDTVPHNRLISKLKYYGINGKIITWISLFLKPYAYSQMTVSCITPSQHHRMPPFFKEIWEHKWQMSFNPEKCFVLRIPASRSPIISNYTLGNSTLQETSSHSYLGVDISNNLKWDTHIDRISATANKTIGFIRRNLRPCTVEARSTAYKALVRPSLDMLEYCCSVWDPYQKGHIKQLGMVQRRAARMVTKKNYNWEDSASKLMSDLKWENLSARRQTQDSLYSTKP